MKARLVILRLAIIKLRQAIIETLILYHFNLECHNRIETNASRYAISRILSQRTLDNLG